MDEPLGTLDAEFREIMVRELRELHNRIHATTVYVTHDQLEAMAMADKIAVMNHGIIEQFATPQEIYARPASMYVADFIGAPPMNFIRFRGRRRAGRADTVRLQRRDDPRAASCTRTSARPSSRSASAPSISASATPASCAARSMASNISAPRRSSRSRPPTAAQGARRRPTSAVRPGETVGIDLDSAAAVALRRAHRPGHPQRAPCRRRRHG